MEEMILNKTIKVEFHQIFSFHPSIGKMPGLKPLLFFDALELAFRPPARFEMHPPAFCGSQRTRAIVTARLPNVHGERRLLPDLAGEAPPPPPGRSELMRVGSQGVTDSNGDRRDSHVSDFITAFWLCIAHIMSLMP
jgi:hypothetical protein